MFQNEKGLVLRKKLKKIYDYESFGNYFECIIAWL